MLLPLKLMLLCLSERKCVDLDGQFNNAKDLENNMKTLGIQLKTNKTHPKRGDFNNKGREKRQGYL